MKKLLFLFFLLPLIVHAQAWQWGRGSTYWVFEKYATALDDSGNVYVGGGGRTATSSTSELAVIKTDPSGNNKWAITAKPYGNNTYLPTVATSLTIDNKDKNGRSIYILGYSHDSMVVIQGDTLRSPNGHAMYFLMKCSCATGNIIWTNIIASSNSFMTGPGTGTISKVAVDNNGNVYVAGIFTAKSMTIGGTTLYNTDTGGISSDVFIAKYTSSGVPVWAKSFGGQRNELSDYNYPMGFAVTRKGNIYIAGRYQSASIDFGPALLTNTSILKGNTFLAKLDTGGNAIWAQNFDRHVMICNLIADDHENFYLVGYIDSTVTEVFGTHMVTTTSLGSVLFARLDSSGTAKWVKVSSGNSYTTGYGISLDLCGNIWIGGCLGGSGVGDTTSFDGHMITWPGVCSFPLFLAEFDTSGGYKKGLSLPGGGAGLAYVSSDIVVDNKGDFYVAGGYTNVAMPLGPDTLGTSFGVEGLFIAKYKYDTVLCPTEMDVKQKEIPLNYFVLFPNPASYECTIRYDGIIPINSKAELYDLAGRLIKTYVLSGSSTVISVAGLAPGMYFIKINGSEVRKFVKQ